ncbi:MULTISPECIES: nitroreductase family protein [unclassified Romboutsia]|uniref:nitroreductase family protein n=1 Tax=unclassified Romboutsia TaxID=2626894 RepID=UPI0008213C8F|nr:MULTISPECIES: nitroreductase family protein [unclassified Romboutsia]SCH07480.1 Nitroreductase family [uncultured Clostridium sp.]
MKNIYSKSISELINLRHSVRNYQDLPLSESIIEKIENYIRTVDNPFNKDIRIKLIKKDSFNKDLKLGTYGVIKGANYFLAAACYDDDLSLMALGYTLEKVILYCTSLGLGTVWLGGTFNKGEFAKAINLENGEILPIISPVGYEGGRKSFIASLFGDNSKKRKNFSEIFFDQNFYTPLEESNSEEYFEPLKMLRLAPSALNKQPWRVLKDNDNIHFYLTNSKNLTRIDIGIALCHFHLSTIEKNISGKFISIDSNKNNIDSKLTYVISWIK